MRLEGKILLLLFALQLLANAASARDPSALVRRIFNDLFRSDTSFLNTNISTVFSDSVVVVKLRSAVLLPDLTGLSNYIPTDNRSDTTFSSKPLLQKASGYISYNCQDLDTVPGTGSIQANTKASLLPQIELQRKGIDSFRSPYDVIDFYKNSISALTDSTRYVIKWPAISLPRLNAKHPVQISRGNISYYYDYRSNIDTPYRDKNVSQHSVIGQMNTTLFNALPLDISFFIRRTNSSLFANINDIRIDFNSGQYAKMVTDNYLGQFRRQVPDIKDSLLSQLKKLQVSELAKIMNRIENPDFQQRLVECNEIIRIPSIAESIAGVGKADSVRSRAKEFIEIYNLLKGKEGAYRMKIDSLQNLVNGSVAKAMRIQEILSGKLNVPASPDDVMTLLKKQGIEVPSFVRHLLALRRFSIGQSQLNYSELTARNLSVNGINVEYNSWYYFAIAAGTIDYRFRDFILNRSNQKPQYMYLVRAGIGRLDKNYIILSVYRGQKQSYLQNNSGSGRSSGLAIYGMSIETKYKINRTSYLITEIAQSATPGVNLYEGQKTSSFFNWHNKISKAYAIKLLSYFPKTRTRLEAMYRYNGAAFQSFDRFQSNGGRETWYIKAEQFFWKRQLKLSASLRNNELTNPYIITPYSNSSIAKSVQLTFRKKNWPVLSAGLMPYSQLSIVGDQVYENRFHTLNAVFYYPYKLGTIRASTTATYNRFYNKATDTGFIYFNSVNLYFQQAFYFSKITLSAGGSHSINTGFELNTFEESIQADMLKNISVTFGLKIINYNRMETKVGSWLRMGYRFTKTGLLQVHYEDGLLPGNRGSLVRNKLCSVMLTKMF